LIPYIAQVFNVKEQSLFDGKVHQSDKHQKIIDLLRYANDDFLVKLEKRLLEFKKISGEL
jgi:phage portal protein BeeE